MNPKPATYKPAPLIQPGYSLGSITDKISTIVLSTHQPISW